MLTIAYIVFSLWTLAGAMSDFGLGTLHIKVDESRLIKPNALIIAGDKIYASQKMSVFSPDEQGFLILYATKKALGVADGKLVLADDFQQGIKVSLKDRAENGQNPVLFNGDPKFQLCADDLIGYQSTCDGAINVSLTYDSLL